MPFLFWIPIILIAGMSMIATGEARKSTFD